MVHMHYILQIVIIYHLPTRVIHTFHFEYLIKLNIRYTPTSSQPPRLPLAPSLDETGCSSLTEYRDASVYGYCAVCCLASEDQLEPESE